MSVWAVLCTASGLAAYIGGRYKDRMGSRARCEKALRPLAVFLPTAARSCVTTETDACRLYVVYCRAVMQMQAKQKKLLAGSPSFSLYGQMQS